MKYQAKPVIVDAFKITEVLNSADCIQRLPITARATGLTFLLDNEKLVQPTPEMMSRMTPSVGDYWVIQSDGYIYLNPKEVFERKYGPLEPHALELAKAARAAGPEEKY